MPDRAEHDRREHVAVEGLVHADEVLDHEAPDQVRGLAVVLSHLFAVEHRKVPSGARRAVDCTSRRSTGPLQRLDSAIPMLRRTWPAVHRVARNGR